MFKLEKSCTIEVGHYLPDHPGKCKQLHGHSIHVTVRCAAKELNEQGMVVDFGDIKKVIEQYDHKCLNELPQFENLPPTSEHLARIIARELFMEGLDFLEVEVQETENSTVTYVLMDRHND